MQKFELGTESLQLSVTCDQRGGRELLVDSALPSLSVFQVKNAKSASSFCQMVIFRKTRLSYPPNLLPW
jgi:hypothetical protein